MQAIHDSIAIKFHLETKIIPPKNPVIIFFVAEQGFDFIGTVFHVDVKFAW